MLEGTLEEESSPVETGVKKGVCICVVQRVLQRLFVYVLRNGELREFLFDGLHFLCMLGGKCICTERSRDKKN